MEDQVPASQMPVQIPEATGVNPFTNRVTPEQLEEMKARARELAIQQTMAQQAAIQQQVPQQQPQIIYVRRNLTVAELVLILLLSCGLVTAAQAGWNFISSNLPRLEIKVK
jgi:hypothetical protein